MARQEQAVEAARVVPAAGAREEAAVEEAEASALGVQVKKRFVESSACLAS